MKDKIFNPKVDKAMKVITIIAAVAGVVVLFAVSTLYYVLHEHASDIFMG